MEMMVQDGTSGTSGTSGANGISTGRTYFFNDSIIEVNSIKQLDTEPTIGAERTVTVNAIKNTDTLIESYISTPFDFTIIPGGVQRFFLWASKDAEGGDKEIYVVLSLCDNAGNVSSSCWDITTC